MPNIRKNQIHLGLGATSVPQPPFEGMEWYAAYAERNAADGDEGRLVAMFDFDAGWDHWEMHPNGTEVVLCTAGHVRILQEVDGTETETTLGPGDYVINDPGVWHWAEPIGGSATGLFITSGRGTEHRPV